MREAMTLRSRDIFSVVPRLAAAAWAGRGAGRGRAGAPGAGADSAGAATGAGAAELGAAAAAFELLGGVEHVLLADPAADAGAGQPAEVDPCAELASLRTSGVT
jgi:hypothetical protein